MDGAAPHKEAAGRLPSAARRQFKIGVSALRIALHLPALRDADEIEAVDLRRLHYCFKIRHLRGQAQVRDFPVR